VILATLGKIFLMLPGGASPDSVLSTAYSNPQSDRFGFTPFGVHREKTDFALLDGNRHADRRLRPVDRLGRLRKGNRRHRHAHQDVGGNPDPRHAQGQGGRDPGNDLAQNPGQTVLDTINVVPGVSFQNNDAYGSSGGTLNIRGFDSTASA
jgi:hypothetical protein